MLLDIASKSKDIRGSKLDKHRKKFVEILFSLIKELNLEDHNLIEVGANADLRYIKGEYYSNQIPLFFAQQNHPRYSHFDFMIHSRVTPEIQFKQKLDKMQLDDKIKSFLISTLIPTYVDLVEATQKKSVIFSNYVLGIAEKENPFWELEGHHLHRFILSDLIKLDPKVQEFRKINNNEAYIQLLEDRCQMLKKNISLIKDILFLNYDLENVDLIQCPTHSSVMYVYFKNQ